MTPIPYILVSITLGQPGHGVSMEGLVTFTWLGSLSKGQVFDVRICPGSGCTPRFGKTNTTDTTWVWCPDGGTGIYRWQVVVIDESTKQDQGPHSEIGEFLWKGGSCASSG